MPTVTDQHISINTSVLKWTLIGSVLGVVGVAVLSARLFVAQDAVTAAMLSVLYLQPYVVALLVLRMKEDAVRSGLLFAMSLVSLVAAFSSLAGTALVLLPATVLLFYASKQSSRLVVGRNRIEAGAFLLGVLASIAFVGSGLYLAVTLAG